MSYSLAVYIGFWLAIINECYLTEKKVIITNIFCALFLQPLFFLPSLNRNLTNSDTCILLYLSLLSSIFIQSEDCSKLGFNMVMLRHTLVVRTLVVLLSSFYSVFSFLCLYCVFSFSLCPSFLDRKRKAISWKENAPMTL